MSHTKVRGTQGGGGVVSHFIDCAIHQQTKQIKVFGVILLLTKHKQVHEGSGEVW